MSVDLNSHQTDAALCALPDPSTKGVLLANEVVLGKAIEAALEALMATVNIGISDSNDVGAIYLNGLHGSKPIGSARCLEECLACTHMEGV